MTLRKAFACLGVVAATTAAATTVISGPAQADNHAGCVYPRFCFYKNAADLAAGRPSAAYRDYGYQTLPPGSNAATSPFVWNTRNDDAVKLYASGGGYACVKPNQPYTLFYPVAIEILRTDYCPV